MDASTEINQILDSLEKQHNVIILFASEAGSRAWKLDSVKSDYDVRFVYRSTNMLSYIHRTGSKPEVISYMSQDGKYDFHGWNLDKAFMHLGQGNCSLFEWCHSPIIYRDLGFLPEARQVYSQPEILATLFASYRGQTISHYKRFFGNKAPDVQTLPKKYLHCVRPLMMCLYLNGRDGTWGSGFTTDIDRILKELTVMTADIPKDSILNLFESKRTGNIDAIGKDDIDVIKKWIVTNLPLIDVISFKNDPKIIRRLSKQLFCDMFEQFYKSSLGL